MTLGRQEPATAVWRPDRRATITATIIPMITMAAMRIHSQASDEPVELVGVGEMLGGVEGGAVGASVVGGTVVGGTVVGTSVVGGAVGEVLLLGTVGRVTLGAALLIALLILLAAPQPAASNPTARTAASRTTVFVRRRMPGPLRAFALWKLPVASTLPQESRLRERAGVTRQGGSCSVLRTTHRKPRWPVAVSTVSLCRAAGR
jgi:hypothetical protein